MGFRCGIIGLPNIGKSTLFNALTRTASAQAANYPFCTIEPNIGEVDVPDPRLWEIAKIAQSKETIPTRLSFVDIAGLVKGASKGEGLGNQFLAHIREVDALAHVLRCFEDGEVSHVENRIDPLSDAGIVETELMLADLESLEKRVENLHKKAAQKDKQAMEDLELVEAALKVLQEGKPARTAEIADNKKDSFQKLGLLTAKPLLYVCNVTEGDIKGNAHCEAISEYAQKQNCKSIIISARIEEELSQLETAECNEYLAELGMKQSGLDRMIHAGYELLDLITFFTAGPKEARAWTIRRNTPAPKAAGVIHTDFEKGFIRAETISYQDYTTHKGETPAKEAGKLRLEGKEYTIQNGDILHFRFAT